MPIAQKSLHLNLTETGTVTSRMKSQSYPGMAYFGGTGPAGRACQDCAFRTDVPKGRSGKITCDKYTDMTGRLGQQFPKRALACKYFEARQ